MNQTRSHSIHERRERTCGAPAEAAPVLLKRARLRVDAQRPDQVIRVLCGHPSKNCGSPLAELHLGYKGAVSVWLPRGFSEREKDSGLWALSAHARRNDDWARRNLPTYDPRRPYHEPRRPQVLIHDDARVRKGKRGAWVVDEGPWHTGWRQGREGFLPVDAAICFGTDRVSAGVDLELYRALIDCLTIICPVRGCGCQSALWAALLYDGWKFPFLRAALTCLEIGEETYHIMEENVSLQEDVTPLQIWRLFPTREEKEQVLRAQAS
ncbi:MAG TPA: hypothetical protein VF916_12985 [Ktedonobacterales bacterium]